jgi:hypothetical protein
VYSLHLLKIAYNWCFRPRCKVSSGSYIAGVIKRLANTKNNTDTKYGALCSLIERWTEKPWLLPLLICLLCLFIYIRFLAITPLLDEQFLLSWIRHSGHQGTPVWQFLIWQGFAPADLWGLGTTIFLKISDLVLFGVPFLLRLERLAMHMAASVFLFWIGRKILPSTCTAFIAAAIFAVYPLNPESVIWLGGIGSLLAGFSFIVSVWLYQRPSWPYRLASLIFFAAALLSSAAVWPLALFYAAFELFQAGERIRSSIKIESEIEKSEAVATAVKTVSPETTLSLISMLAFLVLAAGYIAGTGDLALMAVNAGPNLSASAIGNTLRACFLPINESLYTHYVRHYRFLYICLPILGAFLTIGLWRNSRVRASVVLVAVWLLLSLVPVFGHVDVRGTMFGVHLLYLAMMPVACLIAIAIYSATEISKRWRTVGGVLSAVIAIMLIAFWTTHTIRQNVAYELASKQLTAIQKSMKVVYEKTQSPYLLVRDIPSTVALLPGLIPSSMSISNQMVVFDGNRRLLASNVLSSGGLKEQLRQGLLRDITLRWAEDIQSLLPVELGEESAGTLNARQLVDRLNPGLEFYKQAHFDEQSGELILDSNGTSGPEIRFRADGFSPLGPEYLYIDVKIEAPPTESKPLIELYWTTRDRTQYDEKQRRVWTPASIGDKQYHRYFLPLRGIGWVTSGPADNLTLGFPAGAKVRIREIGGCSQVGVSPSFSVVAPLQSYSSQYDPPFFNFPNMPSLGLFRLEPPLTTVPVSYDCSNIHDATGMLIEISMPNRAFPNTNGDEASGVGGTMVRIQGRQGRYDIPIDKFPLPGVYGLRAVAVNGNGGPVGHFSDDSYCMVRRPVRNGWAR